jgi:2-methylisocitrate lyase-like PEP mutase family enzyme
MRLRISMRWKQPACKMPDECSCCNFSFQIKLWTRHPNALEETLKRVKIYEDAGADGVYPILITKESDIRAITGACGIPVNVLAMQELPGLATLASWGVRRVSMGSTLYRLLQADLKRKIETIKSERFFRNIF